MSTWVGLCSMRTPISFRATAKRLASARTSGTAKANPRPVSPPFEALNRHLAREGSFEMHVVYQLDRLRNAIGRGLDLAYHLDRRHPNAELVLCICFCAKYILVGPFSAHPMSSAPRFRENPCAPLQGVIAAVVAQFYLCPLRFGAHHRLLVTLAIMQTWPNGLYEHKTKAKWACHRRMKQVIRTDFRRRFSPRGLSWTGSERVAPPLKRALL